MSLSESVPTLGNVSIIAGEQVSIVFIFSCLPPFNLLDLSLYVDHVMGFLI